MEKSAENSKTFITKALTKQFQPFLFVLQIFHPYRLEAEQCSEGMVAYRTLRFSWKNPRSFYPYSLLIWNIFVGLIFAFNSGLMTPFPMDL